MQVFIFFRRNLRTIRLPKFSIYLPNGSESQTCKTDEIILRQLKKEHFIGQYQSRIISLCIRFIKFSFWKIHVHRVKTTTQFQGQQQQNIFFVITRYLQHELQINNLQSTKRPPYCKRPTIYSLMKYLVDHKQNKIMFDFRP